MPVIILAGDEDFELYRRLAELKKELLDPAWASVNFVRLTNPDLTATIDAAASLPIGPGNKIVLIDRCEYFTKKKASKGEVKSGKAEQAQIDDFEQALQSVSENTYLIFACLNNFDSTLKLSKAAEKQAKILRFAKQKYFPGTKSPELETWCRKEARRSGCTVDDEAINYLLEGSEANLRQIVSELEKAAVRILPKTHITYETVVELSPYHSHVFLFAEKWLAGKNGEALLSLKEILSRQSGVALCATLQTLLGKWITMKALSHKLNTAATFGPGIKKREIPLSELSKKVALEMGGHPFAVEKDLKRLSRISLDALVDKRLTLTRLESAIKTGLLPENHALDLFLTS